MTGIDAANGEVHFCQSPCGLIGFLTVDADVADAPLVLGDKFFALYKHTTTATAGVKHAPFVGLEHFDQQLDDGAWGVKLPTLFALSQREFAKEVFKYVSEHVGTAAFGIRECDITHQVDELSQTHWVKVLACIDFG